MKRLLQITFSCLCIMSLTNLNANENISRAIDQLDQAVQLSIKIENEEMREVIGNHLTPCLKCIRKEYLSQNYEKAIAVATSLYENIDEILADCQETQLTNGIRSHINEMIDVIDTNQSIN